MANKNRYTPSKIGTIIDLVHIVVGILVIVMAVFAILDPTKYMFLFPLVFFLAGVLSALTGWYTILTSKRNPRQKGMGAVYFVVVAFLLVLTVVSAISIWGNY